MKSSRLEIIDLLHLKVMLALLTSTSKAISNVLYTKKNQKYKEHLLPDGIDRTKSDEENLRPPNVKRDDCTFLLMFLVIVITGCVRVKCVVVGIGL